jgi:hypothetical protein
VLEKRGSLPAYHSIVDFFIELWAPLLDPGLSHYCIQLNINDGTAGMIKTRMFHSLLGMLSG